jgi:hypothetical protein
MVTLNNESEEKINLSSLSASRLDDIEYNYDEYRFDYGNLSSEQKSAIRNGESSGYAEILDRYDDYYRDVKEYENLSVSTLRNRIDALRPANIPALITVGRGIGNSLEGSKLRQALANKLGAQRQINQIIQGTNSGRSDTMTNWAGGDVYDITKAGGALYYAAKIPDVPMPGKKPKLRENAKAVMQTDFLQHEFDMRPLKTSAYDDESSNLQIITYMTTANGKTVVLSNDGVHIDQELSHGGGSGSSMVGGSFGTTTNGNLGTYGVSTQALTSLSAGAKIGGFAGQVAGAMGYGGSMSAFGGALGAMATGNFGEALGLGMQTMAAQAMGPMGMVFGAIGVDVATGNFSNGTMASTTTAMTSLSVGVVSNVATQAIAGAFGVTNTLATLGIGLAISYGLNSALESMAEANRAAYDAMDMETLGEIIGNNALELADRGVIGLDGRFTGETVQDFADYSGHLNSIESATYKGVKEDLKEQATLSGMYNTKGTISEMLGTDLSGEGGGGTANGATGGGTANGGKDAGDSDGPSVDGCFLAGTIVITTEGDKLIEEIEVGEVLIGLDGSENEVLELRRRTVGNRRIASINGSGFFITEDHPIYANGVWTSCSLLSTMMYEPKLYSELGMKASDLGNVEYTTVDPNTTVYNFKLDGNNTYTANGFIVHNK